MAAASAALDEALESARSGVQVTAREGYSLINTSREQLPEVLAVGAELRDRGKGRTVTYSRKVFIPLTNLCRDTCGYCTFAKPPKHADSKTLTPDDVLAIAEAGRSAGCKEALFSLGEKPEERWGAARLALKRLGYESTTAYLAAMCERVERESGLIPHANCGVLTRHELLLLRDVNGSMGLMLESVSDRLMHRGQAHFGCVGKQPETRIETLSTAGQLGIACTTGILIGIGETLEERIDSLIAIRDVHQRFGNIQEVIVQNFRAKPDIRMRNWSEPSLEDMARTIAVARIILGPEMNLQAPPNLIDAEITAGSEEAVQARPDPYHLYLDAGINDWGGISPVTRDHINPERAWPAIDRLAKLTERSAYRLRERLCLYPEYLANPEFVRDRFRDRMIKWTDGAGLVKEEATQW